MMKMALNKILGVHGIVIPEEIDQDLYEKLVALEQGTEARKNYIESLRARLSDEALKATEQRLDSAIAHAKKLKEAGRVYTDKEWMDPKVLSSGLSDRKIEEEIEQSDGSKVTVDGNKGEFVSEYFRTSCPSYYKRDNFDKMF